MSSTVGDEITTIQARLHDSEALWTRTELLRLFNDAYREFLVRSQAFARLHPLNIPGRHAYALTYPWESRHAGGGTWWLPMLTCYGGARHATAQWEVEHLDGVTPSAALTGLTQQWERAHTEETDRHFSFAMPLDHERVRRLEWHNRRLLPVSVREFDEVDDAWMRRTGEPHWWTVGVGPVRSVEVYEIATTYSQAYQLIDGPYGLPREITGERTYGIDVDSYNPVNAYAWATQGDAEALVHASPKLLDGMGYRFTLEPDEKTLGFATYAWEIEQLNGEDVTEVLDNVDTQSIIFGVGTLRRIISTERQYVPMLAEAAPEPLLGGIREWASSDENVMALETVVPPVDLGLDDRPVLIPAPLQKYLRYYVWSRCFGREGEGQRMDLAQHYEQRFQRGVSLFKRLADVAQADRVYRREEDRLDKGRPPRVRLPSTFEQVW